MNNLFDQVNGRLEAVEPTADYIIDYASDIIDEIFALLEKHSDGVGSLLDSLYEDLDVVAANYSDGVSITTDFVNPFNTSQFESFTLTCAYCSQIANFSETLKNTLNSTVGPAISGLDDILNQTQGFVNATDQIANITEPFFKTLDTVLSTSNEIQNISNEYLDMAKEYDIQYRQQPAFIFFCIPMGLIIFVVIGVIIKDKWCFKCEWFCAMYCCGIPVMLLSWPFIFLAVLWADMCVRLDDFEQNLENSQFGQLAGLDALNETRPEALGLGLVNVCLYGESPLTLFNLTPYLSWTELRYELYDAVDVDITSMFEEVEVDSFQSEINVLSIDEFVNEADWFIANANNIGSYCGCGGPNRPFTRDNLYNPPEYCAEWTPHNNTINGTTTAIPSAFVPTNIPYVSSLTQYWLNTSIYDGGLCQAAFINASAAVQVQIALQDEANDELTTLKNIFSDTVFDTYDELYYIAAEIEKDIGSISCLVEPLFDQFDIILDNFTDCGFIGEAYGYFKEAGCVNLFDDWYKVARGMAIIAYISIFIVAMSMCMDYIYGPVKDKVNIKAVVDDADAGSRESDHEVMEMQMVPHRNQLQNVASHSPRLSHLSAYSQPGSPIGVVMQPELAESDVQSFQSYGMISYDNEPIKKITISNVPDLPLIDDFGVDEGGKTVNTGVEEPVVPM